jgi:hypothetical protein
MRDNLNEYNSLISKSRIILPDTTTSHHLRLPLISKFYDNYSNDKELNDFTFYRVLDTYLYRVFNNRDFKQGGRFYGAGYQGVNGDDRKRILINENPTIECDYKAIHPRMCYHLLGFEYQSDPYNEVCMIDEIREAVKILMNIMINVESSIAAQMAFSKWLDEEIERRGLLESFGLDERSLMKRIIENHTYIKGFFNSGKGLELQYLDSCIAEAVLMHFTKQGITCLCIHDSFIVEKRYKDELGEVMKEKYKGLIGFNCKIDFKE